MKIVKQQTLMDRNDLIETREDIVQNIKTLYSYLDGKVDSRA